MSTNNWLVRAPTAASCAESPRASGSRVCPPAADQRHAPGKLPARVRSPGCAWRDAPSATRVWTMRQNADHCRPANAGSIQCSIPSVPPNAPLRRALLLGVIGATMIRCQYSVSSRQCCPTWSAMCRPSRCPARPANRLARGGHGIDPRWELHRVGQCRTAIAARTRHR
jgi:hypothetical protein